VFCCSFKFLDSLSFVRTVIVKPFSGHGFLLEVWDPPLIFEAILPLMWYLIVLNLLDFFGS
jgi:hypothetical protein